MKADFDGAVQQLQPVYGVSNDVLKVALARQSPNPVISPVGVAGLKRGAGYLVELGYFTDNPIDAVLDLRHQPAAQVTG